LSSISPTTMKDALLSVSQAAVLKGVSRSAVYAAIERGTLPHERVLGHIGVRESNVAAWTPVGHKAGRPKGKPMNEDARARISESQKRRWAQRKSMVE
jgi:excisionase family DNA binding protein